MFHGAPPPAQNQAGFCSRSLNIALLSVPQIYLEDEFVNDLDQCIIFARFARGLKRSVEFGTFMPDWARLVWKVAKHLQGPSESDAPQPARRNSTMAPKAEKLKPGALHGGPIFALGAEVGIVCILEALG